MDMGGKEIFYSIALSVSIIIAAIFEPFLGAISDQIKRRIPFLVFFTVVCVFFTAFISRATNVFTGLLFFALANIGYQLASIFYNSLLVHVSEGESIGRVSGLGVGLGYVGTLVGMWLVKPFVVSSGRAAAFVPTALLFFLFSLPCFFFVKEKRSVVAASWQKGMRTVIKTFTHFRQYPNLFSFLISAFWALNAVNTIIIFMAIYANKVVALTDAELIIFLTVSTLFAICGSFASGFISDRFGARRVLKWVYILWCLCFAIAVTSLRKEIFWIVGPLSGIALSSTWVVSRALIVELAPSEKVGEVFGLFGMSGKSSCVLGPLIFSGIIFVLEPFGAYAYRVAIGALIIFMLLGLHFLNKLAKDIR